LSGHLDAAERYGAMLLDHTERHPVRLWHLWARSFNGLIVAKQGDIAAGLTMLRAGIDEVGEAKFLPRFLLLLGELAACLGMGGQAKQGVEIVDEALARCEMRDERWYLPELLRIKGELIVSQDAARQAAEAEALFRRALDLAHQQGALSWELRTATSLARLWRESGRRDQADALLRPIYARFTEGFATADLRASKAFLEELA
jgi:predicted ATPase